MLKHIAYREGLHIVTGGFLFLVLYKWIVPHLPNDANALTAMLLLLLVVAIREVWDLRTWKRAAVRIAQNLPLPGDKEYVADNPWWKSWVDVAGWYTGAVIVWQLIS